MQWLIDLISEKILTDMSGMILLWSGAVVDIPTGWNLCDGNNSTPDLRDRFIVGSGNAYAVNDTGGSSYQTHTFTSNPHYHNIGLGKDVQSGGGIRSQTDSTTATGTTDISDNRPPFYALAYIMKE